MYSPEAVRYAVERHRLLPYAPLKKKKNENLTSARPRQTQRVNRSLVASPRHCCKSADAYLNDQALDLTAAWNCEGISAFIRRQRSVAAADNRLSHEINQTFAIRNPSAHRTSRPSRRRSAQGFVGSTRWRYRPRQASRAWLRRCGME